MAVALSAAMLMVGCAGAPGGLPSGATATRPAPRPVDTEGMRRALAGRVLVAGFAELARGESPGTIAEVVFYRPDGTGFTRVPGQGATRQFAWTVRARQDARGEGYAFISGDGGDDGAAVTYAAERQAVQFSDATYGPAFSFGVLREIGRAHV